MLALGAIVSACAVHIGDAPAPSRPSRAPAPAPAPRPCAGPCSRPGGAGGRARARRAGPVRRPHRDAAPAPAQPGVQPHVRGVTNGPPGRPARSTRRRRAAHARRARPVLARRSGERGVPHPGARAPAEGVRSAGGRAGRVGADRLPHVHAGHERQGSLERAQDQGDHDHEVDQAGLERGAPGDVAQDVRRHDRRQRQRSARLGRPPHEQRRRADQEPGLRRRVHGVLAVVRRWTTRSAARARPT